MKILQVISQLADFAGDSGQVLHIGKILQNLGHEVNIITTDGDYFFNQKESSTQYSETRKKLADGVGKMIEINGIPVFPVHCTSPQLGMYSHEATKIAKKIIKNYDIVHIYSWYHHLAIVFSQIAYKYKVPFFVSVWGTLQPDAHKFNRRKKWIIDTFYTKKMISHATGLHCIGKSEYDEYVKWGGEPNKIHMIDNGIILENFELKHSTEIFKKISINKKTPYILFLGRIHEKKGLELLFQAFKKLRETRDDVILVIAGSGVDTYVNKIKNLAKELNIENFVKFTGFVSEDEKLELMKYAKLFTLTSHNDIHPRAVQEALTMGLPVVITKVCDFPEVQKYNAGVLVDLNIESICHALSDILNNEKNLEIYSQNAKRLIKENFLEIDQVRKYEKLYAETINLKSFQR